MDLNEIMKQAQEMQKKMQVMRDQISKKEYEGKAGGNLVKMVVYGEGTIKSISLDDSLLNPSEREVLEDLIIAAFNEAKASADQDSKQMITDAFGNMPLGSGFKM
ncbi:MAG: YbaB/EbfC family nucleoid-associated protein [Rickettsiaceae bacterium]|nr:YbaB/EbfC family nucleoid-associated protein [Rickettsiaceae bacterium]